MATVVIVSWKGIPAVVEARDETESVTRSLTDRFQALIDAVAMQLGLADSEPYLDLWERSAPEERPGSAPAVADAVAQDLEDRFFDFAAKAFTRA